MLRIHRATALIALLFACAAGVLVGSQGALALFSDSDTGGPLTIASSTLAAPSGVKAAQVNCRVGKSPEISISWSASSSEYVAGYTVERALSASGPYTELVSLAATSRSYTDAKSPGYSTTYYYRVSATYREWEAATASVTVKTTNKNCSGG